MFKQAQPGRIRRTSGVLAAGIVILLGAGVAYAATAPAVPQKKNDGIAHATEYQLAMRVEIVEGGVAHRQARRFAATMCQAPDKAARVSSQAMAVETIVTPLQDNRVRIAITIFDATRHKLAQPVLIGALGDPLRVVVGKAEATPRYAVDVTPLAGCPARKLASRKPA